MGELFPDRSYYELPPGSGPGNVASGTKYQYEYIYEAPEFRNRQSSDEPQSWLHAHVHAAYNSRRLGAKWIFVKGSDGGQINVSMISSHLCGPRLRCINGLLLRYV